MKILLTSLNAKYIHTSLALYYLKGYCTNLSWEMEIKEYTINGKVPDIVADIYRAKADVVGFSCYIWNIEQTLQVCQMLKKINSDIQIILGGPEVSYNPREVLNQHDYIDFVIFGEGEITYSELLEAMEMNLSLDDISGLAFRKNGAVKKNPERSLIDNLDVVPFPYDTKTLNNLKDKIVYYESSRGCPFQCQYCLSSTIHGVRFFSLERVKRDLENLVVCKVKQVKFIDRTFNCDKMRTREILEWILQLNVEGTNFHFEVAADILDDDIITLLASAPDGLFQLEIGVQSTNRETLNIIKRKMDFLKVENVVKRLREPNNVHLHLDLIAGLPREDFLSFNNSFDHVYNLQPHQLQLGFLKLLKGSNLREKAGEYGLVYQDNPPYEVLKNAELSYDDLLVLKRVEDLVERYYNSCRYVQTLDYVVNDHPQGPFAFYYDFSKYLDENGVESLGSHENQVKLLLEYIIQQNPHMKSLYQDLIKLDWLLFERKKNLPSWLMGRSEGNADLTLDFLRNPANIEKYLPHLHDVHAKKIYKLILVEEFVHSFQFAEGRFAKINDRPSQILFDYTIRNGVYDYPGVIHI